MGSVVQNENGGAGLASWDQTPILSVEHLTMRFGGLVAINDLSFNVGRGDITALIGPNGAGKTTVFNCVTGFYKPTEGRTAMRHGAGLQASAIEEVTRSDRRYKESQQGSVYLLERMPDFEISQRAKVARTFQNIRLFGGMTALENLLVAQHNPLMIASLFTIGGIVGVPGYKKAEKQAIEKARYWLEQVHLTDRADDPAADLPYGAQRRLEIARAMCTEPLLLCLDEPAAGLNPRESHELNELLKFIRETHGTSILLIEHDMGVVMEISDHVIVLDYGVKISDGDALHVKSDPRVIAAYLGVDDEAEIDVPEIRHDLEEVVEEAEELAAAEKPKAKPKRTRPSAKASAGKPAAKKAEAPAASEIKIKNAADFPGRQPHGTRKPGPDGADNLTRIKGIGPANEKKLNALGIWHFSQIAAWKAPQVDWVGAWLAFPGRIQREEWVKQAKTLAKGRATAFSKRVDKGEVPTSKARKPRAGSKGGKP
ncbi:MAG: ATP-binding cassette domain-containing protein [Parasphingorhabdus sp.]|uniref:ATP-binding cassette domain-containing protein n=1 Tax=Parasphingorhabdus sp. TaxID=2709688 RepID=UPI003298BBAF